MPARTKHRRAQRVPTAIMPKRGRGKLGLQSAKRIALAAEGTVTA